MINLGLSMVKKISQELLSGDEQTKLWEDFLPLKEALRAELTRRNGGIDPFSQVELDLGIKGKKKQTKNVFSGGYKSLKLKEIYESLPKNRALLKAKKAQDELIYRNLRMAVNEAHKIFRAKKQSPSAELDLQQMGCLALTYATYHYQPVTPEGKKIKFSTYANFWIKAFVLEELKSSDLIKSKHKARKKVKTEKTLAKALLESVTESTNGVVKLPTVTPEMMELAKKKQQKGNPEPEQLGFQFYTEVRDSDGNFTSIFDTLDIPEEDLTLAEKIIEVNPKKFPNGFGFSPMVESLLSRQEMQLLTLDINNPLEVCLFTEQTFSEEAIATVKQQRQEAIEKLREAFC